MRKHSIWRAKKESGTQVQPTESTIEPALFPYRPSWVNRLVGWINRLPISPWLFYTSMFAILTIALLTSNWIDNSTSTDLIMSPSWFNWVGFYPTVFLAAIHHVDEVARRSFDAFRPALGKDEIEAARLRYELTTLPAREAWIAAALGVASFVFVVFGGDYKTIALNFPNAFRMVLFIGTLGFIMSAEMLYHTYRQLRLVNYIHSIATEINPLNPTPLYAFSNLSAQTGLIFLLILWFDLVINPETTVILGLVLFNVLGLGIFAIVCFVLPLWGMHRKLVREKQRLQWEVNQRIEKSIELLHQRVDATDLHDADPLNKSISSLIITHDFIAKTPTWPWKPETFTFFFSALTLPILVFVIQMFLKNILGFK